MKIIVVAIPGSGKSTIMEHVQKMRKGVKIANFGDYMLEAAKSSYDIQNRDQMRKRLTLIEYQHVQEVAAKKIALLEGDVLIDTHASIKSVRGFYPGLPDKIVGLLKPDVIVVLEYDAFEVLKRRRQDTSKRGTGRDVEDVEDIKNQQEINRLFAIAAAHASRCYIKILNLRQPEKKLFEHSEIAANIILKLLQNEQ